MVWDVAISAVLLGIGALTLPIDFRKKQRPTRQEAQVQGSQWQERLPGFYLFVSGAAISFMWPFTIANGVYTILFVGIASLCGLVLLAGSVALYLNVDLKPVAYFAAVVGIYAIIDAYAMIANNLTSEALISALTYLAFAAPAIISVPVAHLGGKRWRLVFAVFAFLFAAAWLFEASGFTLEHLAP